MESGETPHVLVIEDDALIAESIANALVAASYTCARAHTARDARAALEAHPPRVALLDLSLPDASGIELIGPLRERGAHVLVLSALTDERTVYDALTHGACGYLAKPEGLNRCAEAVADALAGGAPISPRIARWLVEDLRKRPPPPEPLPPGRTLTPREREVLELFATGATYTEVAEQLGIAVNTVRQHVRAMYEKLEVSSKTAAVRRGLGVR